MIWKLERNSGKLCLFFNCSCFFWIFQFCNWISYIISNFVISTDFYSLQTHYQNLFWLTLHRIFDRLLFHIYYCFLLNFSFGWNILVFPFGPHHLPLHTLHSLPTPLQKMKIKIKIVMSSVFLEFEISECDLASFLYIYKCLARHKIPRTLSLSWNSVFLFLALQMRNRIAVYYFLLLVLFFKELTLFSLCLWGAALCWFML